MVLYLEEEIALVLATVPPTPAKTIAPIGALTTEPTVTANAGPQQLCNRDLQASQQAQPPHPPPTTHGAQKALMPTPTITVKMPIPILGFTLMTILSVTHFTAFPNGGIKISPPGWIHQHFLPLMGCLIINQTTPDGDHIMIIAMAATLVTAALPPRAKILIVKVIAVLIMLMAKLPIVMLMAKLTIIMLMAKITIIKILEILVAPVTKTPIARTPTASILQMGKAAAMAMVTYSGGSCDYGHNY